MPRYVVDLAHRAALQPALSGGKGSGLAWLHRQHVNVPAGFVITTAAFRDFSLLLRRKRSETARGLNTEGADALRRAIETADFPPAIALAIVQAFRRLGGPVAVRSSAVGEDAHAASFAGQFTTLLQIDGEAKLLSAVRACWASLFACGPSRVPCPPAGQPPE